ncbi:MAG: hypothetical protein KGL39_18980 [Patescibacteria group bacterium]|nr:hypothetical protein [Patescibacteria group bacterium]
MLDKNGKEIHPGDTVVYIAKVKALHPGRRHSNLEVQEATDRAAPQIGISAQHVVKISDAQAVELAAELKDLDKPKFDDYQDFSVELPRRYQLDTPPAPLPTIENVNQIRQAIADNSGAPPEALGAMPD